MTPRWLDQHRNSYRDCSVCVTGGAGFIGSHIVATLDQLGAHITVIDDCSNGRRENLVGLSDRVRLIEASILDRSSMADAARGARVLFHLAALGSVPASLESPERFQETNATGTMMVLQAARAAGVARVVYSASSSAYGDTPTLPKIETMVPDPRSPYAVAKLEGEHLCRAWAICYGLSTISLRYFNIFGPRQRPDSQYAAVIPKFATALRQGLSPTIFGDGGQTRDFTHVDNAVHANLLAGSCTNQLHGEMVNIGCADKFTLLELLDQMNGLLATKISPKFEPTRQGDVRDSLASVVAAKALIGYEPVMPFAEGLRATLMSR
ncbi:MAG: NAD-dependent epimerase/dehydratase family protein [Phycisphaerales bacterium]|nr:NAD-dependent epimerase/dehydratase family protein [Phycisphaerales bacterium]